MRGRPYAARSTELGFEDPERTQLVVAHDEGRAPVADVEDERLVAGQQHERRHGLTVVVDLDDRAVAEAGSAIW